MRAQFGITALMERLFVTSISGTTMALVTRMCMTGTGHGRFLASRAVALRTTIKVMTVLFHGRTAGSLREAITRIIRQRTNHWLSVVRSVDSARTKGDLMNVCAFHQLSYAIINENLCMEMDVVEQAAAGGAFSGFDEVWIFDGDPPRSDLALLPGSTSDGADFAQYLPNELSHVLKQTNCILMLGDGCGLNYATKSHDIHRELTSR